jgi:hypothetical protein
MPSWKVNWWHVLSYIMQTVLAIVLDVFLKRRSSSFMFLFSCLLIIHMFILY